MNCDDYLIQQENLRLAKIKLNEDAVKIISWGITTWERVPLDLFSKEELVILLTLFVEKTKKLKV